MERGKPDQRETLANLVQLYIHDFNELLAPEHTASLGEDGRFADELKLDRYWSDPDRSVWFIRVDGVLGGFALLNKHSHCDRPVDFNMGEFFVTRRHRREGVGARAASDLIEMHAGTWEIAVGARNLPAQHFWPRVIAATKASDIETLQGDGVQWRGPITRFVMR